MTTAMTAAITTAPTSAGPTQTSYDGGWRRRTPLTVHLDHLTMESLRSALMHRAEEPVSRTADGTMNPVGALRRAMATTGYTELKEFQRVEVVVQ